MGWHIDKIEKGVLGESSKILEEVLELIDTEKQNLPIISLWELTDVIGAIEAYLYKHHPSITINDLLNHSRKNSQMFKEGVR